MAFPANVIEVFRTYLPNLLDTTVGDLPDITFVGRPVQITDPNPTVGAFAADWQPLEHEIGQFPPAISRYNYRIQLMIKHAEEEPAREFHSTLSNALRLNLYQNDQLKASLASLTHEALGFKERVQRFGALRQWFFNNDLNGEFLYLTNIDFYVEVEQVSI